VIGQDTGVAMLLAIMSIAIICCIDLIGSYQLISPGKAVTESDYLAKLLQG
jgi:hypothetical protein